MALHDKYLYGHILPPANKQVFGVAGASLNSAGFDASAVAAGSAGEKAVGKILDMFAETTTGFYVFHSVKLPKHEGDIDHLVLYGTSILVIDTKNWAGNHKYKVKYNGNDVTKDGYPFAGGEVHVAEYMEEIDEHFPGHIVGGILCVAKNNVELKNDTPAYDFVTLDGLNETLKTFIKKGTGYTISPKTLRPFTSLVMNPMAGEIVQPFDYQKLDKIRGFADPLADPTRNPDGTLNLDGPIDYDISPKTYHPSYNEGGGIFNTLYVLGYLIAVAAIFFVSPWLMYALALAPILGWFIWSRYDGRKLFWFNIITTLFSVWFLYVAITNTIAMNT